MEIVTALVTKGTNYPINWNTNLGGTVRVLLFKGGSFLQTLISTEQGDAGVYIWSIPDDMIAATDYQIRVGSNEYLDKDDLSAHFEIRSIVVHTPIENETIVKASDYFKWDWHVSMVGDE